MKKLQKFATIIFAACFLSSTARGAEPVRRVNDILYPLLSSPAIIKAGDSLTIELKPFPGRTATHVTAQCMDTSSGPAELSVLDTSDSFISVSIPADFPESLCDISVNFSDGSQDTQPHSLKVIGDFKGDFDFVHFTDIHFNSHDEGDPDLNPLRSQILMEISDLKPEFVLFSGDLGLDPETYPVDYVYGYEQFVKYMKAPMFMVPGNHEMYVTYKTEPPIDGKVFWDATYGPTYRSFDYGNLHVTGINDFDWDANFRDRWDQDLAFFGTQGLAQISPGQWKWLVADLEAAKAAGKNIISFTHVPIETLSGGKKIGFNSTGKIKGPDPDMFIKLMNDYGVSHIFLGHLHFNEIKEFGNLKQVMTTTAGSGSIRETYGFRIVHVKDWKVSGWDIHEVKLPDVK